MKGKIKEISGDIIRIETINSHDCSSCKANCGGLFKSKPSIVDINISVFKNLQPVINEIYEFEMNGNSYIHLIFFFFFIPVLLIFLSLSFFIFILK